MVVHICLSQLQFISSTFIDNQAGDDGGALFIGHTGSTVIIRSSNICGIIQHFGEVLWLFLDAQ